MTRQIYFIAQYQHEGEIIISIRLRRRHESCERPYGHRVKQLIRHNFIT